MSRLDGKVVIITGGASGFGAAMCRVFVREGARVVLADIDRTGGQALASALGDACVFSACDHSDPQQAEDAVKAAIDTWGRLDILVNNAGIGWTGTFDEATEDDWEKLYRVNLTGHRRMTDAALPALRVSAKEAGSEGASLVFVSSGLGLYGVTKSAPYTVSKHAVIGLMRALAAELGPENIRVNAICPGIADTPLARTSGAWGDVDGVLESLKQMTPLRRLAEPDDIANAALYLTSSDGRCVHSQALRVDGGARS